MFQDSAGTTPVTAAGDPVGLWQDKSGNGHHLVQTTDANRPILRQDAQGVWYLEGNGTSISMSVPDSTGAFKFLHDGTGAHTCIGTYINSDEAVRMYFTATAATSASSVGHIFWYDNVAVVPYALRATMFNGSGTNLIGNNQNNTVTPFTKMVLSSAFKTSITGTAAANILSKNNTFVRSWNMSLEPSTANSLHNFTIMANGASANRLNGRVYGLIVTTRYDLRSTIDAWMMRKIVV